MLSYFVAKPDGVFVVSHTDVSFAKSRFTNCLDNAPITVINTIVAIIETNNLFILLITSQ